MAANASPSSDFFSTEHDVVSNIDNNNNISGDSIKITDNSSRTTLTSIEEINNDVHSIVDDLLLASQNVENSTSADDIGSTSESDTAKTQNSISAPIADSSQDPKSSKPNDKKIDLLQVTQYVIDENRCKLVNPSEGDFNKP